MPISDPWVLERDERDSGGHRVYVNQPGSEKSYTTNALAAQRFESAPQANEHACGNEHAVRLLSIGG